MRICKDMTNSWLSAEECAIYSDSPLADASPYCNSVSALLLSVVVFSAFVERIGRSLHGVASGEECVWRQLLGESHSRYCGSLDTHTPVGSEECRRAAPVLHLDFIFQAQTATINDWRIVYKLRQDMTGTFILQNCLH